MKNNSIPEEFRTLAFSLAMEACAIIRDEFSKVMTIELKEDHSPVTEVDRRINDIVINRVTQQFPTHGILGEESSMIPDGHEYLWVVDPIDGTIPFSHGIPTSTFGLAILKDGVVLLGVVADPFMNRVFHAEKGNGAYCNQIKISVLPAVTPWAGSVIGYGGGKNTLPYQHAISGMIADGAHVVNMRSFLYTSALVAQGSLLASFLCSGGLWDIAPVSIIVEEAGGTVTNLLGETLDYKNPIANVLMSNGGVHQNMLSRINNSR